jgi:predicted AAA+ superfamily ATPase
MNMTDATEAMLTDNIFEEYNGALTEQLVLQELKCVPNLPVYYYTKQNSQQEIDFVIDIKNCAVPIEAKAGENLQAKSFKQFILENKSPKAIKTSLKPYKSNEVIDNVPLYALYCYLTRG